MTTKKINRPVQNLREQTITKVLALGISWCAEHGTCTPEIFNRLFKIDNREQKKFLLAHRRSRRKVPYSADWGIRDFVDTFTFARDLGQAKLNFGFAY